MEIAEKVNGKCPECKQDTLYNRKLNHTSYIECKCGYTCSIYEYCTKVINESWLYEQKLLLEVNAK